MTDPGDPATYGDDLGDLADLADEFARQRTQATKLTALLIPADKDQPVKRLELENPNYKTYQGLVHGLIEFLDIPHGGTLCSNEEAKLLDLQPNYRATALLYVLRPEFINTDFIAGDVVLLGQPDEDGETTAAPELFVRLLTAAPT